MGRKRWAQFKTPEQEARALAEREANRVAQEAGEPLPYPNPWDVWDPTRAPRDATPEEFSRSVAEFNKLCRPKPRKQYII